MHTSLATVALTFLMPLAVLGQTPVQGGSLCPRGGATVCATDPAAPGNWYLASCGGNPEVWNKITGSGCEGGGCGFYYDDNEGEYAGECGGVSS